ncbi:MAG: hypothetical protein CL663_09200 [Bacteroidetes bacterium]|nr:hypothetical protein [Bacteroidota bacterium]
MKRIFTILAFVLLSATLFSQEVNTLDSNKNEKRDAFKHAINFCPGGIFFGVYSINAEYLIAPHHGLGARFDYEAVPKTYTDANIESHGYAFTWNYRYHLSNGMNSVFVGSYARFKIYHGEGSLNTQDFDFDLKHITLGLNVGKRWVWNSGFNVAVQLGYGFAFESISPSLDSNDINIVIDIYKTKNDFIDPLFGEVSIGFAF